VHAGLISFESLVDGTVDLSHVALLNDSLAVRADNDDLVARNREN
jgi:hypothetical protein